MKQRRTTICTIIAMLLFMALPAASAQNIDITDLGHYTTAYWADIEGLCGYVEYQNVANYTIAGAILIFVDGNIVAGKVLNMRAHYIAGFQCNAIKTLEFPINDTEGRHRVVAHIYSMNSSVVSTYDYYVESVGEEIDIESETKVEEDWLRCWWCREE